MVEIETEIDLQKLAYLENKLWTLLRKSAKKFPGVYILVMMSRSLAALGLASGIPLETLTKSVQMSYDEMKTVANETKQ